MRRSCKRQCHAHMDIVGECGYEIKQKKSGVERPQKWSKIEKTVFWGGKPTSFFKKIKRTKFGNGESIWKQAGAVILKTRVTAACQKNASLI